MLDGYDKHDKRGCEQKALSQHIDAEGGARAAFYLLNLSDFAVADGVRMTVLVVPPVSAAAAAGSLVGLAFF